MVSVVQNILSTVSAKHFFTASFTALFFIIVFGVQPASAAHYLDDKILQAGEPEMTRSISDGSNYRDFNFSYSWSIAMKDKLSYMISLNDSESPKAQQALDNLNSGGGYIVSTTKNYPGSPIQVAFYDPNAEVNFYQYYHPSATAYAYRAPTSPYFYLMTLTFSGNTDNNINTYNQTSLSHELYDNGAVYFSDYSVSAYDPSNYNFIYSNYNYMYQRHFFSIAMNNVTYPSDYKGGKISGASKLDYLALGDSYSSGEGDIERKANGETYYLGGTDIKGDYANGVPDERCHISSRSFPFILAKNGAVNGNRVQSVACSGAKRVDVQGWNEWMLPLEEGGFGRYSGQAVELNGRQIPRLEYLSNGSVVEELQENAKLNYIPGRIQQIDFIEKYKPDVVTLTLGGNDLGFGRVLRACISQVALYGTCDYATEKGRKESGSLIRNFRMQLVNLYEAAKKVSPTTKLYVLGYPQFISSTQGFCGTNSTLNRSDREFIAESITYLNQVTESAAQQAGVYYVNIESALGENILCTITPDKYVNGVTAVIDDSSEAFHPNKKGHAAIASHIKEGLRGETLKDFNDCENNEIIICPGYGLSESPSIPEYLNPLSVEDRIVQAADVVRDVSGNIATSLTKGAEYVVRLNPFIAQPTTLFNISLHSEPLDLGSFTVAADGSLSADITVPSTIPAGYHTLYATGKSYSGEDITFRQIVEVHGSNPADIDDNNIPDTQQACGPFFIASGMDSDLDGVDDACDPQISEKPELYRWRFGQKGRLYNNIPESMGQVYIERNVWASSATSVSDDYDPDGDGWAIVGATQGSQLNGVNIGDSATMLGFEVLGKGTTSDPYLPVLYVLPGSQLCRAYRPASLSQALANESRTLNIAQISNERCPQKLQDSESTKNGGVIDQIKSALKVIKIQLEAAINSASKAITKLLNLLTSLRR